MIAAATWFVTTYGSEIPWADDWSFHVPQVSGERPADREWLLNRFGEYPTPLSKWLLYALCKQFGFRGELYVHIIILGALSAALILTAGHVRGRRALTDSFFPLALLHFGSDNFIWESQLVNFLPTVFVCILLMIIACWGVQLPPWAAIGSGLCVLGLSLSGPAGLVYVPGASLWLAWVAATCWFRSSVTSRLAAVFVLGLLLAANQFLGFALLESLKELPGQDRPMAQGWDTMRTSVQLLSMAWGNVNVTIWKALGLGLLALAGLTVAVLLFGWLTQSAQRGRAFGFLIVLASAFLLVVGTGRARGAFPDPKGLQNHYVPHVVAIPILIYLTWIRFGPIVLRRVIPWILTIIMLAALPLSIEQGLHMARRIQAGSIAFEEDVRAGKPPEVLAERHSRFFFDLKPHEYAEWEGNLSNHIRALHRAGIGVFAKVNDPAFREFQIPLDPIDSGDGIWSDGVLRTTSSRGFVTFALPEPTFVLGIRVHYSYRDPSQLEQPVGRTLFQIAWKKQGQDFADTERTEQIALDPDPQIWGPTWIGEGTLTVWVNDTIDRFRLYPMDRPGFVRLKSVKLLLSMVDYQLGTRIATPDPTHSAYFDGGWHDAEGDARWTSQKAGIAFGLPPRAAGEKAVNSLLRMRVTPFGPQRLVVRVNGHDLIDQELGGVSAELVEVDVPGEILSERNVITFVLPRAHSPKSVDGSDDDRVLGMAVEWWELLPKPSKD